ncbi:hypothetical protein OG611_21555 [Streptomyces sp. NBC_01363]|nr:hypothetical protein [Streptomyces sp. NBC_01363]
MVTAPAARGVLKERLRGVQAAGAGLTLVGTVLLATGRDPAPAAVNRRTGPPARRVPPGRATARA